MTKSKKSNLISWLSVLVLLLSLLLSVVNVTSAYFTDCSGTDGSKTIYTIIKTGESNLWVYQENSSGTQTKLAKGDTVQLGYSSTSNNVEDSNANSLKLLLKNEDKGTSFGIKYKVTFYIATPSGKKQLSSTISGMTAPTSSANGFVYNSTDGYYYYRNSSNQNVVYEPATDSSVTSRYLMTSFTISYDDTVADLLGGNSIFMELSVESVTIS